MALFKFLNKRKIDSALVNNRRSKAFLNFKSIKKVLVVFNIEDWEDVSDVIDDLQKNKKNVEVWTVRPKSHHDDSELPSSVRVINAAKEQTWTHALNDNVIGEFEELKYDTFIDLTTKDNNLLNYLLAANASKFCIGIRETEMKAYDFIMLKKESDSIYNTYEQMKSYLNSNIK